MYDYGDVFSVVDTLFPTVGLLLEGGVVPLISVAIYVFTALSMHTIAQKRGIACPWLAWIPVANLWVLGSVSDPGPEKKQADLAFGTENRRHGAGRHSADGGCDHDRGGVF